MKQQCYHFSKLRCLKCIPVELGTWYLVMREERRERPHRRVPGGITAGFRRAVSGGLCSQHPQELEGPSSLWAGTPFPLLPKLSPSPVLLPSLGDLCVGAFCFCLSWHQCALNSEIPQFPFFFSSAPLFSSCPKPNWEPCGPAVISDGMVLLSSPAGPHTGTPSCKGCWEM